MARTNQFHLIGSYHSAFNLQNHFSILQYSPGIEEYALLLAYEDIRRIYDSTMEHIVFDMPPTALTLKFITLPFVSLLWLEELKKIRTTIKEKKEIMSKIKFGKKEFDTDKVATELDKLIIRNKNLNTHFLGEETLINLVMNYDRLSFAEAKRLKKKLENIGIKLERMIVNKVHGKNYESELRQEFSVNNLTVFPMDERNIIGISHMREYLSRNDVRF